ncbi:hypothetical protein GIB67_016238 [Kingdonia uniflora]|uniref:Uncharacterized protein n=1 Tax=Kingdonia uniflora TaxID=39325 RepID=A0A7J7LT87_9MAGN|nr:hypothetical protein GIB67_016238 [Kingdonia uniflora]
MIYKFVVRASDASIIKEIESDLQGWLDNILDGDVEYMPEENEGEQEDGSVEKKKKKKKNEIQTNEEDGNPKGPSAPSKLTAEKVEHGVLQATVLQEWYTLCKERAAHIKLLESTPENRIALLMGLEYLIDISYVDDTGRPGLLKLLSYGAL